MIGIRERIANYAEIQTESLKESITQGIFEGFNNAVDSIWDKILSAIFNGIDGVGLIAVMVTWLLFIMSVPNAGRWCYTILAFYIVAKVTLKAFLLLP